MKQLEQIESRNHQITHHTENYVFNGRNTPSVEASGRKTPTNEGVTRPAVAPSISDNVVSESNSGRKTPAPADNNCNEEDGSNLLPEQTYTIEKRTGRSSGLQSRVQGDVGEKKTELRSPGSVSSGVYTMTSSGRNSDTTSTTSPEPPPELAPKSSDVTNKQWNQVDDELRKIIRDGQSDPQQQLQQQRRGAAKMKDQEPLPDVPPGTPPLPPVSPGNSPSPSPDNSPKLYPKSKYKLSLR